MQARNFILYILVKSNGFLFDFHIVYYINQSPPFSADVKNAWNYASNPQYVFMAWCLVKHRDFYYINIPPNLLVFDHFLVFHFVG